MPERDSLPMLLDLIRAAPGPSRKLDARIEVAMRAIEAARTGSGLDQWRLLADDGRLQHPTSSTYWLTATAAGLTSSRDDAVALIERILPGWWWKCGSCCVSDDARIAPDVNSTIHGARLRKELGPIEFGSEFDTGFDVDRRPPGNVPLALLEALIRALIAIEMRAEATDA